VAGSEKAMLAEERLAAYLPRLLLSPEIGQAFRRWTNYQGLSAHEDQLLR
jgi:hypothetical protein